MTLFKILHIIYNIVYGNIRSNLKEVLQGKLDIVGYSNKSVHKLNKDEGDVGYV